MTTVQETRTSRSTSPTGQSGSPARGPWLSRTAFALTLGVLTLVFLGPLAWMFLTSFKTQNGATQLPPTLLPHPATTSGYHPLLNTTSQTPVIHWFLNSLLAGAANAVLVTVTASLAAYAVARMEFPGRRLLWGMVVGTLFIPPFLFLIPNYIIVSKLAWLDSLWAVIVPSAGGAFGVFFLRQFFSSLPHELEEAAMIDGANRWQIFTRVVLPLSRPALSTLLVLQFLTNYNDFLWPIFVLFSPAHLTLPAGLSILQGAFTINYPVIMAGAAIASIPAIVLFVIAQRSLVESVSRSGLKG
ncbi:carbohydrate ABC transporter membrane protein 2 (CUT1 family) [Motilibacter rhizosphaerae]|uniref:Carbohydrate ABC transporter membrane protein 2 (CUT1 family) n=1 Tax=Motilibacter rhizosphaerae TaxID=598652 RepID=A0A4V2F3D4_9ACTN|nr:carbohydrate ABC transporter permease [Motilibacter rhizosphaerae]RZS82723.1 carbohydrate ABC transporter membrane protein 2 (CUT1 family) [Motilibacter rhizosphaerae]